MNPWPTRCCYIMGGGGGGGRKILIVAAETAPLNDQSLMKLSHSCGVSQQGWTEDVEKAIKLPVYTQKQNSCREEI